MGADLQDLAEKVKDTLNAAAGASAFVTPFTAARSYRPQYRMEELATLRVTVVGRKSRTELLTREGLQQVDYDIDVAVQKKLVNPDTNIEADALSELLEQIRDWFFTHVVTGREETLVETDTDATAQADYSVAHYRTQGVFFGVVTLTFRGAR
jgi:ribonucleotide monophosphatase NagD (HAD superfamily)